MYRRGVAVERTVVGECSFLARGLPVCVAEHIHQPELPAGDEGPQQRVAENRADHDDSRRLNVGDVILGTHDVTNLLILVAN